MTNDEAKLNMSQQIDAAIEAHKKKAEAVHDSLYKAVERSCLLIEGTSKRLMRDTITNPDITYWKGKRHNIAHHPSMPYEAPASDTGTMIQSITHDVTEFGGFGVIIGRVGSTIKDPPYPSYLENGTYKMAPRPWLLPSMTMNQPKIEEIIKAAAAGNIVEVNIDVTD